MNTAIIINRTTLNGTEWKIVADCFGVALYMNEEYSGYYFKSVEEARAHLDAIDEKVKNPVPFVACTDCGSFYGRGSNVYYGD